MRSVPLVWHVAHDTDVSPAILDPARNLVRVRLEKWAVNFGARYATRVVVQTRHQAGLLEANFGRAPDAIIPNFHPVAHEALDKTGPTTVVWVANLKPWKRPDAFIRLAAALSDLHDVRFVMIGAPGSSRWQEDLAKRIDATPNLVYLGEKTQAEVNELLARSTLFVNTSAHEGFPNTFIQSWLRDVAVVSLDVDPDGVLEKSQVGIVAKSESALAGAVRELLEQTSVRAGYVERGRIHAAAMHSLRNIADLVGLIDRCGDRANG